MSPIVEVLIPGIPGVGLPAGGAGDVGKVPRLRRQDGNPYDYELVTPGAASLPQALDTAASPTFAGLSLSGIPASQLLFTGTGGALTGLGLGAGLSIVGGALTATGGATDLAYDPATRLLSSSTGADVPLPLADATNAGLLTAAEKLLIASALQAGQAFPSILDVRNASGGTLTISTPVYVPSPGSSGTRPLVAAADASSEATAARTLGLMWATAAHNSDCKVITHGILPGVNTSTLTEGAAVWLSETTGQLTSTRPTQPAHGVFLGFCIKQGAGASGILYVNVINGAELDELHDVLITGLPPAVGAPRPALVRSSTGLWVDSLLTPADVGAAAAGAIGSSGLTMTAGIVGRETGTGAPQVYALGAGLAIVGGALTATATGGGYPSLSMPTGFSVAGNGTASLVVTFAAGYALPTTAKQAEWDTAYSQRLYWDGGSAGLNAATGRASLQLGSAAQRDVGTAAGNVPVLDGAGLVPSALLPGFVDDVLEYANIAAFPATGETGKLYISLATNRQYRWSGSVYVEINPSPGSTDAVPEGSVNLYFTSARGQSAASAWWSGYRSTIGDQLATAATQAAGRDAIGAGTSNVVISSATPQPLGTPSAGSTGQAADIAHVHAPSPVVTTSAAGLQPATSFGTITYAATTNLDMAARDGQTNTLTLAGDVSFTVSNLANGRTTGVRIIAGAASRTLTFPAEWTFIGTKPASIPSGKTAKMSIECYGTTNADVLIGISIQS
jgi:hypothetical protein